MVTLTSSVNQPSSRLYNPDFTGAICAQNHELTFRSETNWWTTVAPSLRHVMVSAAMHLAIDWNDCLCTASPPCDWVGL